MTMTMMMMTMLMMVMMTNIFCSDETEKRAKCERTLFGEQICASLH